MDGWGLDGMGGGDDDGWTDGMVGGIECWLCTLTRADTRKQASRAGERAQRLVFLAGGRRCCWAGRHE